MKILFALLVLICIFKAFDWKSSAYKAEILNREYGTNYTQEEVFYASSVIETVRELERKRVEINGNLLKSEKQE